MASNYRGTQFAIPRQTLVPRLGDGLAFGAIKICVLAATILSLVDGASFQMQMLVTGGLAPITGVALKLILCVLLLATILLKGRMARFSFSPALFLLILYLATDAIFLYFQEDRGAFDILTGYNSSFMLFVIMGLTAAASLKVETRLISRVLLIVFPICAALGIAQYILNLPIVPTESADGNFRALAWQSTERIRSFSLFRAPGYFGLFSAFMACIAVTRIVSRRNLFMSISLFALGTICCYAAGTRSAFISLVAGSLTAILLVRGAPKRMVRLLPLAWVVCGVGIAFFAYEKLISTGATNGVEGTYSFGERIIEWTYFLSDLRTKQVSEILLGQGLVQGEGGKGYQAIVPVDNLYLGFVLHIGVLGLAVVANLFRKLWLRAQELAREGKTDIGIASAAMFSTVFAVGIFANDYATLDVLLLLAFISGTDTSEQDKCEV